MDIKVLLATDENYAMPTGVTITSIMENASVSDKYIIYIMIPAAFSEKMVENLKKLESIYQNLSIFLINMQDSFCDVEMNIAHITVPTYYRLVAAELLPDIDKCIYLDSDIIVDMDLSEYYDIDITDYYMAGVKALAWHLPEKNNYKECRSFGLSDSSQYINAGAILLNLRKIREDKLTEVLIENVSKNFPCQDQDILNLVFYPYIKILPLKYNLMIPRIIGNAFTVEQRLRVYTLDELLEAKASPVIIHYCAKSKPWQDLGGAYADKWWHYAYKSIYAMDASKLYIGKAICESRRKDRRAERELKEVKNSYSFKIGQIITYVPRRVRKVLRYYKNNGTRKTIKKILEVLTK